MNPIKPLWECAEKNNHKALKFKVVLKHLSFALTEQDNIGTLDQIMRYDLAFSNVIYYTNPLLYCYFCL